MSTEAAELQQQPTVSSTGEEVMEVEREGDGGGSEVTPSAGGGGGLPEGVEMGGEGEGAPASSGEVTGTLAGEKGK